MSVTVTQEYDTVPDWARYAIVTFHAQEWIDDYAVTRWQRTYRVPIDAVTEDDGTFLEDNTHQSDQLRWHDNAPQRVQDWDATGFVSIDELHPHE